MAELIWDFYRKGASDEETQVGALIHYYDQSSQSIFVKNALYSRESEPQQGQWETSPAGEPKKVTTDKYNQMEADHSSVGVWYGSACIGDNLYLLRYLYAKDLSDYADQATYESRNDNSINQLNADIQNMDELTFTANNSLFVPNSKLELSLSAGNSDPYLIGIGYLDEIDYDLYDDTVPISARSVTALLNDQTFGEEHTFNVISHELFEKILKKAGIEKYHIQTGTDTRKWEFDYDTTLLDGLSQMFELYWQWEMVELPDGTIVIGNKETYIPKYKVNNTYQFNGGKEVFTRKTTKSVDAAYSRVLVRCGDTVEKEVKDSKGHITTVSEDKYPPVSVTVKTYSGWNMPANKTFYAVAKEGLTKEKIQEYAEQLAKDLQYVGVTEAFTSPIRPWLLVGDVASIYRDGDSVSTSLGLITSVKHILGKNGFSTEFSVDSGGDTMGTTLTHSSDGGEIITSNRASGGYTRKTNMTDVIRAASGRRGAGSNGSAGNLDSYITKTEFDEYKQSVNDRLSSLEGGGDSSETE